MKIKILASLIGLTVLCPAMFAQDNSRGDFSSPMAAVRTYFTAMQAGDTNIFQRATLGTEYQKDWMVAYLRSSVAADKLTKASEARFGHDETARVFGEMQRSAAMATIGLAALTNAGVKIDGTNATIAFKPVGDATPDSLKLQQAGGDWKIVLGEDINKADFNKDAMNAMADSTDECAQAIAAGKYKTAAEASQAMMSAMMNKMQNQGPPK